MADYNELSLALKTAGLGLTGIASACCIHYIANQTTYQELKEL